MHNVSENLGIQCGKGRDMGRHDWFDVLGSRVHTDPATGLDVYEPTRARDCDLGSLDFVRTASANSTSSSGATFVIAKRNVASPVEIVGRSNRRTKCNIRNTGTESVMLGTLSQVSTGTGYILPAGQDMDTLSGDPLYAVGLDANVTNPAVTVWSEETR